MIFESGDRPSNPQINGAVNESNKVFNLKMVATPGEN